MTPSDWLLAQYDQRAAESPAPNLETRPSFDISSAASWPEPKTVDRLDLKDTRR